MINWRKYLKTENGRLATWLLVLVMLLQALPLAVLSQANAAASPNPNEITYRAGTDGVYLDGDIGAVLPNSVVSIYASDDFTQAPVFELNAFDNGSFKGNLSSGGVSARVYVAADGGQPIPIDLAKPFEYLDSSKIFFDNSDPVNAKVYGAPGAVPANSYIYVFPGSPGTGDINPLFNALSEEQPQKPRAVADTDGSFVFQFDNSQMPLSTVWVESVQFSQFGRSLPSETIEVSYGQPSTEPGLSSLKLMLLDGMSESILADSDSMVNNKVYLTENESVRARVYAQDEFGNIQSLFNGDVKLLRIPPNFTGEQFPVAADVYLANGQAEINLTVGQEVFLGDALFATYGVSPNLIFSQYHIFLMQDGFTSPPPPEPGQPVFSLLALDDMGNVVADTDSPNDRISSDLESVTVVIYALDGFKQLMSDFSGSAELKAQPYDEPARLVSLLTFTAGRAETVLTVGRDVYPGDAVHVLYNGYPSKNLFFEGDIVPPPPAMDGNVTGTVYNSDGSPLPYASVAIAPADLEPGPNEWEYMEWAYSDAEGNYAIQLPTGSYVIRNISAYSQDISIWQRVKIPFDVDETINTIENPLNIEVRLPAPNVSGAVYDGEQLVVDAFMAFAPWDETENFADVENIFDGRIDEIGVFNVYLPPGQKYTLMGLGGKNIPMAHFIPGDYVVDLTTAESYSGFTVTLPEPNVTGVVYGGNGSPVQDAYVELGMWKEQLPGGEGTGYEDEYVIPAEGGGYWIPVPGGFTDINGVVELSLNDGSYVVLGIGTPNRWVDMPLTVADRVYFEVSEGVATPSPVEIRLPEANVTGQVTYKDGGAVPYAWMRIREKAASPEKGQMSTRAQTDSNGYFELSLDPGTYIIEDIQVQDIYLTLNKEFAVPTEEPLDIKISGANVTGTVYQEDSVTAIPWSGVQIVAWDGVNNRPDFNRSWWAQAGQDGRFRISLEPGNYVITGISTSERWVEMRLRFGVDSSGLLTDKAGLPIPSLSVAMPSTNVRGLVVEADDVTPVTNAWLEIREMSSDWTSETENAVWVQTDLNGIFRVQFEPGNYLVKNVSTPTRWQDLGRAQDRIIVGESGVVEPKIALTGPNVTGTVRDEFGTELPQVWLSFRRANAAKDDWSATKWTQTDASGSYAITLNGGEYMVSISTPNKWIELKTPLTVDEGQNVLDIAIPAPNVNGTVYDEDGQEISKAGISIKPANAGPNEWEKFRWVEADEDGRFGIDLELGNYIINGLSTNSGWVEMNLEFSAPASGLEVRVPGTNVVGVVYDGANAVNYGWINFAPYNSSAQPQDQIDWNNSKGVPTDAQGRFRIDLEPGSYIITGISTATKWVDLVQQNREQDRFTVTAAHTQVNKLALDVQLPVPNVTGTAFDENGSRLGGAWLTVRPASADKYDYQNARWTQTDDQGNFQLSLTSGNYVVASISTNDRWVELEKSFTAPQSGLEIRIPADNVIGTVYEEDGLTVIPNVWVDVRPRLESSEIDWQSWKGAKADQNGIFRLNLSPGNWVVTGISTGDRWINLEQDFTVGEAVENLSVVLPGMNVSGEVYDENNNPLPWAGITIARKDGENWLYESWTSTNQNGEFSISLSPSGYPAVYRVAGISAGSRWVELPNNGLYEFTLNEAGSKITGLAVALPQPSVSGRVYDTEGRPVSYAWLQVSPWQTAGGTDWGNSRFAQTDAAGYFTLSLEGGKAYIVTGVSTENSWIELGRPADRFNVDSDPATIQSLEINFPAVNVRGAVYKGDVKVTNGWIRVIPWGEANVDWTATRWAQIDADGTFALTLDNGDWAVLEVSTSEDGWISLEAEDYVFNVNGTTLSSVTNLVQNNELNVNLIQSGQGTVSGVVYNAAGQIMKKVWVAIKPLDINDWTDAWWVQTDENGRFTKRLDAGEYKITDLSSPEGWTAEYGFTIDNHADKTFTVTADEAADLIIRKQ